MTSAPPLVRAHRILAAGLAVFILGHLATHLTAVMGPQAHVAVLKATQGLYRNPFVEPVLIAALLVQIVIGARLLAGAGARRRRGSGAGPSCSRAATSSPSS